MKCTVCGENAVYTYHGDSYCEKHFKERTESKISARLIYLLGIGLWLIIWGVFIYGILDQHFGLNMFLDLTNWWVFALFSVVGCVIGLSVNAKIWWTKRSFEDYKTEVGVIEFVERNVGPLITANSIVLSITFLAYAQLYERFPPASFILYEIFSLAFACLVLPLYWVPSDSPRDVVKLRHIKTIFFFYSVFFLFASLITLALCVKAAGT